MNILRFKFKLLDSLMANMVVNGEIKYDMVRLTNNVFNNFSTGKHLDCVNQFVMLLFTRNKLRRVNKLRGLLGLSPVYNLDGFLKLETLYSSSEEVRIRKRSKLMVNSLRNKGMLSASEISELDKIFIRESAPMYRNVTLIFGKYYLKAGYSKEQAVIVREYLDTPFVRKWNDIIELTNATTPAETITEVREILSTYTKPAIR